jgi:hypothetical protein
LAARPALFGLGACAATSRASTLITCAAGLPTAALDLNAAAALLLQGSRTRAFGATNENVSGPSIGSTKGSKGIQDDRDINGFLNESSLHRRQVSKRRHHHSYD